MPRFLIFSFIATALFAGRIAAQTGSTFAEFSAKLEPYFANELIEDVKNELPQGSDFRIWSWDVGDFSGDGFNDLAFAVRLLGDKRRVMQVFLFADEEGYLKKVRQLTVPYVELPLEAGVVIRDTGCFVTEKKKQFNWIVRGYRYKGGDLMQTDEFITERDGNITRETYRNYSTLEASEKTLPIGSGDVYSAKKYFTLAGYSRGRQIYRGYTANADIASIDYVLSGAYYWNGPEDCSFSARAAYDDQFLYMTVNVRDDEYIAGRCDTCTADYIEFWFNSNPPDTSATGAAANDKRRKRRKISRKQEQISQQIVPDSGLYGIIVRPGDFLEKRPQFDIVTTDDMEPQQRAALSQVKISAAPRSSGYIVKIRIPFMLFGFQQAPVEEKSVLPLGCTIMVHDSDNEFRPEEETRLADSPISVTESSTYGSLLMIPPGMWYGETVNLYAEQLLKYLSELGY
ncbi:hypothetical protein MASR2M18_17420 [Ignavibacteria bacterium]|nr:hypothetical protein [Bacteroidota bacterium]MCZ2132001.1 hypothetical protein [Bacteroidota bacterium]